MNPVLELSTSDWLSLFNHFASLSLLAVGGAITVAPDMHRFLVEEKLWLSESQFTSSIALAQAAPGPNILFVALMGFNVGMNAGAGLGGGWVSVGLASLVPAKDVPAQQLLERADHALLLAKRRGRNRVEAFAGWQPL